ncbi:MAG: F0F1 ATP synthase subunit A [Lachnospiraceae bacterium]|nr:F0F1 ATP synthase subunit A [Lachnospiraceae bacterium]
MNMLLSSDDLGFMIEGVYPLHFGDTTLWITTSHICLLIVMLVLIIFSFFCKRAMNKATDVPGGFQNFVELIVELLDGLVQNTMGWSARIFRNYIGTIFIFILFSNISGLFGLRPPTADYGVTFPLGVTTFTLITICKFKYQKVSGVIKGLCDPWPFWLPINLIGDFAVPISLSLRLFANVLSGTVMMALVYGLLKVIAYAWPAALHVYFDMFSGAIQTYVFCMLTMTYISDACGDEVVKPEKA